MTVEERDVLVIGGGPAGSTFAGILKKYAPDLSVTVLEQARFPRYHIGESTIPAANGALRELGVLGDLARTDFVKKLGIVFVWGADRTPWNADYLLLKNVPLDGTSSDIIDVTGQDLSKVAGWIEAPAQPLFAFNVRRAELDKMLLDRARVLGAEVREGTRASEILRDEAGAVCGVRFEDDAGREGTLRAPFVLDASGLSSMLTRGARERDPAMNNFAVYSYLSNAQWKVTYNGARDGSTVFIAAVEKGWIWYFPIGPDIMSVGAVTRREHFVDRLKNIDLEAFWWEMVESCPEVRELVKGARVRTDILPDKRRVAASEDWSSWAREPVGPGWAAAGDAAVFVDPILSSGVTLAIQSGHRAACTFLTARARPDLAASSLWRAYAGYIRGEASSFLTLARYFYGNNRAAASWWWESQRVVNRAGRLDLDDRQSFTMATAGFFPVPRAISPEVVLGLLERLSGTRADLTRSLWDTGLPPPEELARCGMDVRTPFRIDVRAEPFPVPTGGQLDVFHDLVTDDLGFAHRAAAVSCRIDPSFAALVDSFPRHRTVASLLAEAPALVPGARSPESVHKSALGVVAAAALKSFVGLTPCAP